MARKMMISPSPSRVVEEREEEFVVVEGQQPPFRVGVTTITTTTEVDNDPFACKKINKHLLNVSNLNNHASLELGMKGNYVLAHQVLSNAVMEMKSCLRQQEEHVRKMMAGMSGMVTTHQGSNSIVVNINDFCSFLKLEDHHFHRHGHNHHQQDASSSLMMRSSSSPSYGDINKIEQDTSSSSPSSSQNAAAVNLNFHEDDDEECCCFLYRRPIEVSIPLLENILYTTTTASSATTTTTTNANTTTTATQMQVNEILTLVTVYNLALCEHMMAASASTSMAHQHTQASAATQTKFLKRSITLYSQAAKFLSYNNNSNNNTASLQNNMMTQYFRIVIANNLGHAYTQLNMLTQAKQCFEELAYGISLYHHNNNSSVQQQQLDKGFIDNVVLMLCLPTSTFQGNAGGIVAPAA